MIKAATFISRNFLKDRKEFELEQLKSLSEFDQIYEIFLNIFKANLGIRPCLLLLKRCIFKI